MVGHRVACLSLVLVAASVQAQIVESAKGNTAPVICSLANGDRLSGTSFATSEPDQLTVSSVYGIAITIPASRVLSCRVQNPEQQAALDSFLRSKKQAAMTRDAVNKPAGTPPSSAAVANRKRLEAKAWKRNVNLTYAFATGNLQVSNVGVAGSVINDDPKTRFTFTGLLRQGDQNRQSSDLLTSVVRLERKPTAVLSLTNTPVFGEVHYEQDALARLDHRFGWNGGITVALMKKGQHELSMAAGGGLTYEMFGTGLDRTSGSGLFRVINKLAIFGQAKLNQQLDIFPSLSELGHYRATAESTLLIPFSKTMSVQTGIMNRYDNWPKGQAKANDFSAQSGFLVSF